MTDKTAIIIPARIDSTRYPEKMLVKVDNMHCLVQRVKHWCDCAHDPDHVYVATDSKKIASLFPDNVIMTSESCRNGTERIVEAMYALEKMGKHYNKFINVQGDMIDPPITTFRDISNLLDYNDVVTVVAPMEDKDRNNPNSVKAIHNGHQAQWFCRAPLNYGDWHLGIYGYTKPALAQYPFLEIMRPELEESLEQLRWLNNNVKIAITYTEENAEEINTPLDLINWKDKQKNDTKPTLR